MYINMWMNGKNEFNKMHRENCKYLEIKFSKKEILSKNNYSNTLFISPSKH